MKVFKKIGVACLALCIALGSLCSCKATPESEVSEDVFDENPTSITETATEATNTTTEATTTTSETTVATTTTATEATEITETYEEPPVIVAPTPYVNEDSQWVTDNVIYYESAGQERPFHTPTFNFNSVDADATNDEIAELIENKVSTEINFCYRSDFMYYIYDNYLTLILRMSGDWDCSYYYIWTFNTDTGSLADNNEIFEASNSEYGSITEAATVATTDYINNLYFGNFHMPTIIDGALNPDVTGVPEDSYSLTFNEENLNDDMSIGLDSDGNLIFISDIFSLCGASYYIHIYNAEGARLDEFLPGNYSVEP